MRPPCGVRDPGRVVIHIPCEGGGSEDCGSIIFGCPNQCFGSILWKKVPFEAKIWLVEPVECCSIDPLMPHGQGGSDRNIFTFFCPFFGRTVSLVVSPKCAERQHMVEVNDATGAYAVWASQLPSRPSSLGQRFP